MGSVGCKCQLVAMSLQMISLIVILIFFVSVSAVDETSSPVKGEGVKHHLRTREFSNAVTRSTFSSPSAGTDVISHPIAVIKCANQTLCIQPKLQLTEKYDVYFCKHVGFGVRFYYLAKEGLLLHPNIRMVDDIEKAQMIVYLPESAPWHKSECNRTEYTSKTIVLDEGDGPNLISPEGTYLCLKCRGRCHYSSSSSTSFRININELN